MHLNRRLILALSVVLVALLLAPLAAARAARTADSTKNVNLIATFPYENPKKTYSDGGSDLDFSGRYVYAMQQGPHGGVHIFDASEATPEKVNFFPCPGEQNDVAVVKPGLIAIGFHKSRCGRPGKGVKLLDVSDPEAPKVLGQVDLPGGTHTLTTYPGKEIVYASPGGLANGAGIEQILDVSNPRRPKVAGTFRPNGRIGCHDVAFYIGKGDKLAGCAGGGEAQLWDVSDPTRPKTIAHLPVPAQFPHSFAFTHDGKYAVVGDEAIGANDCVGGVTGALWIYDIQTRETPVLVGHWGPQRGPLPIGASDVNQAHWCSAHNYNFVPGTYTLVSAWYAGGMSVIDLSDPAHPEEVAYYMGTGEHLTNYWSAYWHDGRIWASDRVDGLEVFTVKGVKEGD